MPLQDPTMSRTLSRSHPSSYPSKKHLLGQGLIELVLGYEDGSAQSTPLQKPQVLNFYGLRTTCIDFFFFFFGPVGVQRFVSFQKATWVQGASLTK